MRFEETATLMPPPLAYRQARPVASPALGLLDASTAAATASQLAGLVRSGASTEELSRPGSDGWSSNEARLRPLVSLAVGSPPEVCHALERSLGSMQDAAPAAAILRHRGIAADVDDCLLRLSYQGSYGRDCTRHETPASPHRRALIAEAILIGISSRSAAAHGVHARWLRTIGGATPTARLEGRHGVIATVLESWARAGHVPRSLVPVGLDLLSQPGRAQLGRLLEDDQERYTDHGPTVSWRDLGSRLIGLAGDHHVRHRQVPDKTWLASDMETLLECYDGPPF